MASSHRLVPAPCLVHPERVTDYPARDLPEELAEAWQDDFRRLAEAYPLVSFSDAAEAPGITLGGYPSWFTREGPVEVD
ncbi:hypothetical protein [Streptomyces sp. NPDC090021]|uniref:hypothetical protein n=1 Tax=Streptomyces sp. NPDC090021 TaxID=3365919 RepID=UPI0037FF7C4B